MFSLPEKNAKAKIRVKTFIFIEKYRSLSYYTQQHLDAPNLIRTYHKRAETHPPPRQYTHVISLAISTEEISHVNNCVLRRTPEERDILRRYL